MTFCRVLSSVSVAALIAMASAPSAQAQFGGMPGMPGAPGMGGFGAPPSGPPAGPPPACQQLMVLRDETQKNVAAIQAANHAIFQKARLSPELTGMGTTLVGLLHIPVTPTTTQRASDSSITIRPVPPSLWLAHVGDSRCYRRRGRELIQLTDDHSFVEEQIRAGQITAAEAASRPSGSAGTAR